MTIIGEEMRDCPHCGGQPFSYRTDDDNQDCHVECERCGCRTSIEDTMPEAIRLWNRRVGSPEAVTVMHEALERIAAMPTSGFYGSFRKQCVNIAVAALSKVTVVP